MSDIRMFPMDGVLQHRVLEQLVLQWDGSQEQALVITEELQRELPPYGAQLESAHYRSSIQAEPRLEIGIVLPTKMLVAVSLTGGEWLVIDLHENRVHDVNKVDLFTGEERYHRSSPVIVLTPRPNPGTFEERRGVEAPVVYLDEFKGSF